MGDDVIHLRHFRDGYPFCWPMDKIAAFKGTYDSIDVTCPECRRLVSHEGAFA